MREHLYADPLGMDVRVLKRLLRIRKSVHDRIAVANLPNPFKENPIINAWTAFDHEEVRWQGNANRSTA